MSTFTFGTPTTTNNTSFGFGQKPATGFNLTSVPFGSTTPASTLSFGASTIPATTSSLNFGFSSTPATSTQAQSSNLVLGSNVAATTTATSLFPTTTTSSSLFSNLSFGTPAASTSLTFGTPTNTSTTGNITFSAPTTTNQTRVSLTRLVTTFSASLFGGSITGGGLLGSKPLTSTSVTTTTNKGLGGLDVSVSNKGLSQGTSSPATAKDNVWPPELMQTIDKFKEFVKEQKVLSSDIARGSARPLNRCAEDTTLLMEMLTTLAGSVQRDRSSADKLKQDTARALQNAEIAQRTHDTPLGLQYENNAPLLFFMELADNFEHDLMLFRSQIETTEKHIQAMMTPKTLTPQELTMAMSKLHESLVAVAGKLQGVHSKVQQHKEQYLNFRKYVLKDNTNVFEDVKTDGKTFRHNFGKITSGPTPFGPGNKSFLSSTALNSNRPGTYETRNPLVWGNAIPTSSATNINLGPSLKPPTASLTFNIPTNLTAPLPSSESSTSFQLQKPPVGNKRGKH